MAENVITFPIVERRQRRRWRRPKLQRLGPYDPKNPATMVDHRGRPLRRVLWNEDGTVDRFMDEDEARFLAWFRDQPIETQNYMLAFIKQLERRGRLHRLRERQGTP
jgi:hypothetical protein